MKVGWIDPFLNPALFGKGVVFPIGSVFHSHRIRNHECLGDLIVQSATKLEVGMSTKGHSASVRQRGERRSNAFSRRKKASVLARGPVGDFERIIAELKVGERFRNSKRKETFQIV
jgi:hypothetical protein